MTISHASLKVSRRLRYILNTCRPLWIRLLLELMDAGSRLPNSFQLDTMSADELRECAVRPYRIDYGLLAEHFERTGRQIGGKVVLSDEQHFSLAFDFTTPGELDEHAIMLLPGGRWIIAKARTKEGPVNLFCWDYASLRNKSRQKAAKLRSVAKMELSFTTKEMAPSILFDPPPQYDNVDQCTNILVVSPWQNM